MEKKSFMLKQLFILAQWLVSDMHIRLHLLNVANLRSNFKVKNF